MLHATAAEAVGSILIVPNHTLDLTQIESRLERIYDEAVPLAQAKELISEVITRFASQSTNETASGRWSEKDIVLITYGDQVRPDDQSSSAMQALLRFLGDHDLFDRLNTVHFLPCFPYSSDDGFSVIDYRQIDPELGTWDDVASFRERSHLMFDFVVNHVSQECDWFQRYLKGESPYDEFFIEADPNEDLSGVTRPRSLPLLSDFETSRGKRWLWTTFSRDQVDLNYASPQLMGEVIDILLLYISHGTRIVRLDAIAYLWKEIGTPCIHLRKTHEVVKLLRDVVELVAPHVLILTETNVPHAENVSYFGTADEAHMVYQFSLPPLLLDAFLNEDAKPFKRWLSNLEPPIPDTTYFNFTASHDGVGVRPLEGQVSNERLASLVEQVRQRGARVGTKRNPDGTDSPYELNVSYVDALGPVGNELTTDQHAERFLASQAIMLSLQGMPAVYFHSLVGTQNDTDAVEATGIPRRINRRKFTFSELENRLGDETLQHKIFVGMKRLMDVRVQQPAFHPDGEQTYIESGSEHVVCFERRSPKSSDNDESQRLLVIANFHEQSQTMSLPNEFHHAVDLLNATTVAGETITLRPSQVVWLAIAAAN